MRNTAVKRLYQLAQNDKNLLLMIGDLGYGVLTEFAEKLPNQFINAGICEQNMTSVAAGLALEGKTVFTYSIANFPTLRCLEQIRNDVSYHEANVKIIAVGGGFSYGSLGMSHHATEDLAIMRALPGMRVFAPGDLVEAEEVISAAYKTYGPCYIRLGKGNEPRIHDIQSRINIEKAIQICSGKRVCLFSTGGILAEAMNAIATLKEENIECSLFSFPTVKPIDVITIIDCAIKYDVIVTIEEHNVVAGFGSAVSEVMSEMRTKKAFLKRIGLNDMYSSIVGSQEYLRNYYGISEKAIVETVKSIIKGDQ